MTFQWTLLSRKSAESPRLEAVSWMNSTYKILFKQIGSSRIRSKSPLCHALTPCLPYFEDLFAKLWIHQLPGKVGLSLQMFFQIVWSILNPCRSFQHLLVMRHTIAMLEQTLVNTQIQTIHGHWPLFFQHFLACNYLSKFNRLNLVIFTGRAGKSLLFRGRACIPGLHLMELLIR